MIINPTHEITLSGLPSDVLDAYVRYKKGSRAIVTWLVQFGPVSYKGVRTLPIKELGALAQKVSAKITSLPDVIDFHFRETIAARKCLSKYFRENRDETEDDFDTVNHEHFTSSLNDIYRELCERCRGSEKVARSHRLTKHARDITESIRNHYGCLPVEQVAAAEHTLTGFGTDCQDCTDDLESSCVVSSTDIDLEGDDVAIAIENVYLLDRAQEVFDSVEDCWTKAGAGDISLLSAAGTTSAAWKLLLDIESRLKVANPDTTLEGLHRRSCVLQVKSTISTTGPGQPTQHKLLLALSGSERSIKHYTDGHKLKTIESCASCIQKPGDYIQSPDSSSQGDLSSFQIALLDNIFHLINRAGSYPTIALNSSPCLAEIGCLLSHIHDQTCTFQCTLNIHLLAISYQAFMAASAKPSSVSTCRVSALRLAQQAASTVKIVLADKHAFPCQCPQTIAYHMSSLEHDLTTYAKHRCWDLYFQSPWVAGMHMTEMLDMLAYYGMRLFHYRHYVGSVLHAYNVVQQLGGLEPITPLEQICYLFRDLFFPAGGRPSTSFKNSWSRFVGARLKFKRDHKVLNHRESWCMAIPPHAARAAAGLGSSTGPSPGDKANSKFDYGRYDPLIKLKQNNYNHIDQPCEPGSTVSRPSTARQSDSTTSSATTSPRSSTVSMNSSLTASSSRTSSFSSDAEPAGLTYHPLHNTAQTLDQAIRPHALEAKPFALPTTRLNLLAVFATCTEIVSKISDKTHTSQEEKPQKNCICFTTTLLAAADRIVEGRKLGRLECWRKSEREIVEIVKTVTTEVMAEIEQDNGKKWLWDI